MASDEEEDEDEQNPKFFDNNRDVTQETKVMQVLTNLSLHFHAVFWIFTESKWQILFHSLILSQLVP